MNVKITHGRDRYRLEDQCGEASLMVLNVCFLFSLHMGPFVHNLFGFVRSLIEMTQHMGGGVKRTSQTYLLSNDYTFYHISDDFTLLVIFQVFPCYDYELLRAPIDERRNEDQVQGKSTSS